MKTAKGSPLLGSYYTKLLRIPKPLILWCVHVRAPLKYSKILDRSFDRGIELKRAIEALLP